MDDEHPVTPSDAQKLEAPAPALEKPVASIIIPTYNRAYVIWRVIDCLLLQTLPQRTWELVIVDDGSSDNTKEMLDRYQRENPDLRLVYHYQQNQGPAKARNEGIRLSSADIVCVLDSDALPAPTWLEELLKGFDEDPLLAGVGGRIHTHKSAGLMNDYNQVKKFNEVPGGYASGTVTFLMTGSMSHRRDVLLKVGGFNEQYPHFGDDNEMGERVRLLGYHYAYNPASEVDHLHRDTFESFMRRFFWLGHGCLDMVVDTETRLSNRSHHRVMAWIWTGFYGKTLRGLFADLPKRLKEGPEGPWRSFVYWGLDVLMELSAASGTLAYYLKKYVRQPWDKSLYPMVYAEAMGLEHRHCPRCNSARREKYFFGQDLAVEEGAIHLVSRCLECQQVYLPYPPPVENRAVKSEVPLEEQVALVHQYLPGGGKIKVLGKDEALRSALRSGGYSVIETGGDLDAVVGFSEASALANGQPLAAWVGELKQQLKPGGLLILEAANPDSPLVNWFTEKAELNLPQSNEWAGINGWKTLLEGMGLVVQHATTRTPSGYAGKVLALWWKDLKDGKPLAPLPELLKKHINRPPWKFPQDYLPSPEPEIPKWCRTLGEGLKTWMDNTANGSRLVLVARKK